MADRHGSRNSLRLGYDPPYAWLPLGSNFESVPVTTSKDIRLMIVDDHAILRAGVRSMLDTQPDIEVVAEAVNGLEALEQFPEALPNVVLMDLKMPRMDGLETTQAILSRWPRTRIVILTTYTGDAQALRALKAGAAGYLLKNSLRKELVQAIRSVHQGHRHLDADVANGIAIHAIQDPLSEREIEVLTLAAAGNSNRSIAGHLGVAEETVKGYMKAIFGKLNAADRTHAVAIAAKRGMIQL